MTSPQQLRAQAAEHFAAQRFAEAGAVYGALLTRAPQDFEALHKLGIIRLQTGGHAEGLELIATALTIDPNHAEARMHHGMALQNLGRAEEAAAQYRLALSLRPDFSEALFQLGAVLRHQGRLDEALTVYGRCAVLAPQQPNVFLKRGEMHFLLGAMESALADFDIVLRLQGEAAAAGRPTSALRIADMLFKRALTLENLGRELEALAGYEKTVQMAPGHADAWNKRGNMLRSHGWLEEAEASYRRALALNPNHVPARTNRGTTLAMLGRNQDAVADFQRLLEIEPANPNALGGLLSVAQPLCDWDMLARILPRLTAEAPDGRAIIPSFAMTLAFDDPRLLHDATAHFRRIYTPPGEAASCPSARAEKRRPHPPGLCLRRFSQPRHGLPDGRPVRAP